MLNTTRSLADRPLQWLRTLLASGAWGLCSAAPLLAETLALPSNARESYAQVQDAATYSVPVAPYAAGTLPALDVSGHVSHKAFRIPQAGLSPEQIIAPIEAGLSEAGFEILFKCQDRFCGGFDFRFKTEVAPAPAMFVDLFDFTFLTARRGLQYVTLLASRDSAAGYVQIIEVSPDGAERLSPERSGAAIGAPRSSAAAPASGPIGEQLEARGRAILSDLAFETGSANLGAGPFASLEALASYLAERPNRRIALVGHTDSTGSLDVNIAISQKRAASVLERLAKAHLVPRTQMEAEGMGYLAPLASNLSEEGRQTNRRVEAILLSTE